jgi:hypothetical protein
MLILAHVMYYPWSGTFICCPVYVLQNTTQSSSGMDECAMYLLLICKAFENIGIVIYVPYWADVCVLVIHFHFLA